GGMTPGDTLEEQAGYGQNLLNASGIPEQDARIEEALDLSGSFVVQTPEGATEQALTAELQAVPNFVYVQPFEDDHGGADHQREGGGDDGGALIGLDYYGEPYGPFDYDRFLAREKNGESPPQGGPVTPPPAPADALTNNNAGSTGTTNFTQSE